ncbi:polyadenylate-binding -interacting 11-like [Micractinium conductrix]|uniref:Polyadenylate-binding -interacting 11-like n=1 Tax=Micractinium conductrix TaxID=554055 RepID=A0A2P6VBA5_9CHLO|nr:polyadenylate-binding -interacting 11-like [Micractinium conductrix]|eukprot:PSC71376.1 polyadenylate-binding -interacting 11-like [Micractinium conductrix]
MQGRGETVAGGAAWPPASQAQDAGRETDLQGLGDQLLAAQLHALQLGGSSTASRSSSGAGGGLQPTGGQPSFQHLAGLPPGGAAAAMAAAAMAQQQQQQGRALGGRRRGGGGGRRNEEKVRRTVYISDISDAVSEAQLASFFADCGQLVDCRVCGDPNSSMRFAFIEFVGEEGAHQALSKSGSVLGDFPIRVSPSKTAIVPVNNTYLPRSNDERELVARTVFVGNVDRVLEQDQLREFFDSLCGPVSKIRLLGDAQHTSKIAFVEFVSAEGARGALKLSGALLGTLPLRVSPSKTPVRVDSRRNHDDRNSMLGSLHLTHAAAMQQAGIPAAGLHAGGLQQPLIMPAGLPAAARPGAGLPRAAALPGMLPPGGGQAHVQLPPALLMAVAGLQMGYPGMPSFPL